MKSISSCFPKAMESMIKRWHVAIQMCSILGSQNEFRIELCGNCVGQRRWALWTIVAVAIVVGH
jgi:hypothetical protein